MYEVPIPNYGALDEETLDKLDTSGLPSCSSFPRSSYYRASESSMVMGFSSFDSLPSVFEPTPINPKSSIVVESVNFNSILTSHLLTLIEDESSSWKRLHHWNGGPVISEFTKTSPKRHSDDLSLDQRALTNKRPRKMSNDGDCCSSTNSDDLTSLRSSHVEQWGKRFSEMVKFQKEHGHCLVPLSWEPNPALAHWVKRQRYQYRIKQDGKHSTMTPERFKALEDLGFTWDSHSAAWLERWQELAAFKQCHGHANVPKKFPENQQLAVWVKCQRRQYKLFTEGKCSNITLERIERLNSLGFVFKPRELF